MKKRNLLSLTLFILMSSLLLTDCSKDKKLERTLYKKEGTWNITSVTWEMITQDTSGQNISTGTTANAGTFSFDKSGSGTYDFTVNGTNYSQSFSWSVSDEKISITKVAENFNLSGNFDQLAVAISGTQQSKSNITLEGSETHQYSSGVVTQKVLSCTFSLTKQ